MVKCNSCGGVYTPDPPDGSRYDHVCPPLSVVELAAAVQAGRVTLPAGERAADAVQRRVYERANKRDETLVAPGPNRPPVIRSEGAGVTPIADALPAIVIVPE